jgi:2-polyprenyl-3-methyl-5-hydroxy-6-metoxy-1,4-benzoquinol methylase
VPEGANTPCPVCGGTDTAPACVRRGRVPPQRDFTILHCRACRFSFIPDYRADFADVYGEDYYRGRGADPLVNYAFDHERPEMTVRAFEWEGLVRIFRALVGGGRPGARWLDYGCGLGSLVRYGRGLGIDVYGYEPYGRGGDGEGLASRVLRSEGELRRAGPFDFVTAIEVIEHSPDPVALLRSVRSLVKPGGVLFLTTGNAEPWRGRLGRWSYTGAPDVHMSFFEPGTLALALEKSGFAPEVKGYLPGFTDVIKYKILKNLGIRERSRLISLVPWPIVSRIADLRYRVTDMPLGVAAYLPAGPGAPALREGGPGGNPR